MEMAVELIGWDKVADNWYRAPEFFERELTAWAETAAGDLTNKITKFTPRKSGDLRKSIMPREIEIGQMGVSILVGTPLNYAVPVELGSKPHDITPKSAGALSFIFRGVPVLARKVHHPGTQAYLMFDRGLNASREDIQQTFSALVDRLMASLAGRS